MFADGRVQLQVIGGQLRRLPRRIETIGSQLERNVRAEHKDVPRPPGTRMDRFVGRGADDHPGWRGAYRRCGATFGLGGVAPSSPRRRTPTVPRGGVVGLAGRLLVLRPLRTSLMRTTLIAGSWQTIPRREFAGGVGATFDRRTVPSVNKRSVRATELSNACASLRRVPHGAVPGFRFRKKISRTPATRCCGDVRRKRRRMARRIPIARSLAFEMTEALLCSRVGYFAPSRCDVIN